MLYAQEQIEKYGYYTTCLSCRKILPPQYKEEIDKIAKSLPFPVNVECTNEHRGSYRITKADASPIPTT